jgi:hypothetical protein
MHHILEKLLESADNHADDTGEDHNVGDLEGLLSRAWSIMTLDQRITFLKSDEVEALVEAGAREEFSVEDLLAEATLSLELTAQGYRIKESDTAADETFHWVLGDVRSKNFPSYEAAAKDAHRHLKETAVQKK